MFSAAKPGQQFIESRPNGQLWLVEVGARQYRATRHYPADMIELRSLGECDRFGRIIREFDCGPLSHRIAPGVLDDFQPLPASIQRRAA